MNYNTYPCSPLLTDFVKCFWSLEAPVSPVPERQRIVPDGCMEMIFHYGDPYRQYFNNETYIIQPSAFVFGQLTAALEIAPTGITGIIAARFHPNGFAPFTDIPVSNMENRAVTLNELFGKEGTDLEAAVLLAQSNEVRISIINHFLSGRLNTPETIDRVTQSSMDILLKQKGQLSVDELAEQIKVNRRQLERKFSAVIGMSPKQLSKIIRLQAALKMIEKQEFTSLTSLAYENGYFDQAHFIKDFKEFTGMSPKQFYAGNLKLSSLFIATE